MSEQTKAELLTMLVADEDDKETRMILADLLEEMGEDDEAARHRAWNDSKQWMNKLVEEHADSEYHDHFSVKDLLSMIGDVEPGEEIYVGMGDMEGLMYQIYGVHEDFWKHWSILTGVALSREQIEGARFKCAC